MALICFKQILNDDEKSWSLSRNKSQSELVLYFWPYRILIIGDSGTGKNNVLFNGIKNQQPDTDKIYLYVKHPSNQSINCLLMEEKK